MTYADLVVLVQLGATRVLKDVDGEVIEMPRGVDVVETFTKAVDKNAGVGGLDVDFGIRHVVALKVEEAGVAFLGTALLGEGGTTPDVAACDSLHIHLAKEPTRAFCDTEEQEGG